MTASTPISAGNETELIAQRVLHGEDYVVNRSVVANGGAPTAVQCDLWQTIEGRVVSHWGEEHPWVTETANGHTQIDGATEIDGTVDTESTRRLATAAVQTILADGDVSTIESYLAADYVQHNPRFADGTSGLMAALTALAEQGVTMRYDAITHVVAEGDFAYLRSEGTFANEPFVFHDLFRVANGRRTEHWDVMVRRA